MARQSKQQKKKKTTKKNTTKKKVTISVSQKAKVVKKDSLQRDMVSLLYSPTPMPHTNGIPLKIRIRKK